MMHHIRLQTLAVLSLAAAAYGETCYFPDGSVDVGGIPCPRVGANEVVACCRQSSHYCLTNGLCIEPNAWTMYRNSCTDKNFRASGCPTVCHQTALGSHTGVNYCLDGATWTCLSRKNCEQGNFTMPKPRGKIMINAAAESDMGIAAVTTNVGASGTSIAVCSSAAGDSSDGSISVGAAAGIGVGVGVPLAIAVGALTILLLREKRKTRAASVAPDRRSQGNGGSVASQAWAKQEYTGGFLQTPQSTGYGHQAPATMELPPDSTVRHELPQ
ncbi:hypothetical protein CkaCkLH20_02329 [Colletotrichum karsti]|uniref:Uncharacterized protein n=1 Tax=Colletotrichum karsti TaxID=1095194 RepID=A0A9P6IIS4_9PEZI|nr:uncharacterized protein CkaCkLH20_02329 [Colletotrichum karsti]KAF9880375.1 hypothetical protein CkaCkLH20_02329 [Colletotrichum karsti]